MPFPDLIPANLRGTLLNFFRLGNGGPQLKQNVSNKMEVRLTDDSNFDTLAGASPVQPEDFTQKQYVDAIVPNGTFGDLNSPIPVNLQSLDWATKKIGDTHFAPSIIKWTDSISTQPGFYLNWSGDAGATGLWVEYIFPVPTGKTTWTFSINARLPPNDLGPGNWNVVVYVFDVGTVTTPLFNTLAQGVVVLSAIDQAISLSGSSIPGHILMVRVALTAGFPPITTTAPAAFGAKAIVSGIAFRFNVGGVGAPAPLDGNFRRIHNDEFVLHNQVTEERIRSADQLESLIVGEYASIRLNTDAEVILVEYMTRNLDTSPTQNHLRMIENDVPIQQFSAPNTLATSGYYFQAFSPLVQLGAKKRDRQLIFDCNGSAFVDPGTGVFIRAIYVANDTTTEVI